MLAITKPKHNRKGFGTLGKTSGSLWEDGTPLFGTASGEANKQARSKDLAGTRASLCSPNRSLTSSPDPNEPKAAKISKPVHS